MDDTRTQQALDHLADLFLTGQGPVADAPTQPPAAPTPPAAPAPTPSPIEAKRDDLAGPAPIRLRPKLTENIKTAPPVAYTPPVEGNAPLRLQPQPDDSPLASIGEAEPPVQEAPVQAAVSALQDEPDAPVDRTPDYQVAIEAVILGNLPGLSGPWLTQYAQLLAQQEGPVAILHVDDDLIDLEMVEPTNRDTPDRGISLRMPPGGGQIDPRSILEAMLDSPNAPDTAPKTVLVHLDPLHEEQGLTRALCIDDWTLMCGADDLAIVGGYKMLKNMVEAQPAVASKRLGLMIMGSAPKDSQDAAHKFQSAAESFLKTPVQLLGWQKQMVPVNLRHLGRFEDIDHVWPRLAEWFSMVAPAEPIEEAQPVAAAPEGADSQAPSITAEERSAIAPPAEPTTPDIEEVDEAFQQTQPEPQTEPEPVAVAPAPTPKRKTSELFDDLPEIAARPRRLAPAPPQPAPAVAQTQAPKPQTAPAPQPQYVAPQPTIQSPPAPAPTPAPAQPQAAPPTPQAQPQPAQTVANDEPNLVELLMSGHGAVPGGIALEARCPHHNQTQLMLDQDGRLHLLCRHDSEGFDSLQSAMVDLLQARHWVHEHLQLIALTQRQLKFDATTEPVLHLFTDRADWATALIARLGEALKLHLLQEVSVGQESAWFCTPLN